MENKKLAKAGSDSASWRASAFISDQTTASSIMFSSTLSAVGDGEEWLSCPGICLYDDFPRREMHLSDYRPIEI